MREYDYDSRYKEMLTPDIVALLTVIHEYKGGQTLFIGSKADKLTRLSEIAKLQSTEASNKIEGIRVADSRLKKIVRDKTTPQTRSEKEIAGYRDVLATIHESHDFLPPKPSVILQLHKDLYRFSGKSIGGQYRSSDNVIEEDASGNESVRFQPVASLETPEAMESLCTAFDKACENADYDPLLLIPMFILDFLCIHPFNDGNGRMSRLLTLLLLYRAGCTVGKYISIEKIIEQSEDAYYEALRESSADRHEGGSIYTPFVRYMLGVIASAYRDFSSRLQLLSDDGISKPERVRMLIKGTFSEITKTEILNIYPDVSHITVHRVLNELVKSGEIKKISGGRYTSYTWNREND